MEFTHYIPQRNGTSRELYQLELQAWREHSQWVVDHSDMFSDAMRRFQIEELQLLDEVQHRRNFRAL